MSTYFKVIFSEVFKSLDITMTFSSSKVPILNKQFEFYRNSFYIMASKLRIPNSFGIILIEHLLHIMNQESRKEKLVILEKKLIEKHSNKYFENIYLGLTKTFVVYMPRKLKSVIDNKMFSREYEFERFFIFYFLTGYLMCKLFCIKMVLFACLRCLRVEMTRLR